MINNRNTALCLLAGLLLGCSGGGGGGGGSSVGGGSGGGTPAALPDTAAGAEADGGGGAGDGTGGADRDLLPASEAGDAGYLAQDDGRTVDPLVVNLLASDPEFTGASSATTPPPGALTGVDRAYAAALTGAGQTVAVLDAGVRLDHPELDDKTVRVFGAPGGDEHGTEVTGIAVAERDGAGMFGTAYGADLHVGSYEDPALGYNPNTWAAATRDAATVGAVVQNNSWGFDVDFNPARVLDLMAAENIDAAEALARLGRSEERLPAFEAAQWQDYAAALDEFQRNGVVVFAISNDSEQRGTVDTTSALPALFPELREAWLTVANIDVIDRGDSFEYRLVSAPCGQTAPYCLGADGNDLLAPTDDGSATPTGYAEVSGTSFAAPQVSGAVALLAEAFPDHTPAQLTNRLLATAQNDFFTPDGTVDFGGGVVHGYSERYGHGFLNLEAALAPVGPGMIVTARGRGLALSSTELRTGPAMGDGAARALQKRRVVMLDALGGGFAVPMAELVEVEDDTGNDGLERLEQLAAFSAARGRGGTPGEARLSFADGTVLHAQTATTRPRFGFTTTDAEQALLDPIDGGQQSAYLGLAGAVDQIGTEIPGLLGDGRLSIQAFTGRAVDASDPERRGVTATYEWPLAGRTRLLFGAGALHEGSSFLGGQGSGALQIEGGASRFATIGIAHDIAGVTVSARYERGVTRAAQSDHLITAMDAVDADAFRVALDGRGVFTGADRWRLSLSQPLRAGSAEAELTLPVARRADGSLVYERQTVGLTPSGRQIDIGLAYGVSLGARRELALGAVHSLDHGHVEGAHDTLLLAHFGQRF